MLIPPPSTGKSVEVSFVMTAAAPTTESWVGRNSMGTSLIGAVALSSSEWLTLVWREISTPVPAQIPLPPGGAKRLTSQLSPDGGIGVFLWALDGDGVPWLLLGRFDDESVARFREKWAELVETPGSA
jgi:hypothetical protein